MLNTIRKLKNDKRGIAKAVIIAPTIMIIATIMWGIAIGISQNFYNSMVSIGAYSITLSLGANAITAGSVVIAIIDIGMVAWFLVAVFSKKGEEPDLDL